MNIAARPALDFILSTSGLVLVVLLSVVWMWRRPQSSRPRRFLLAAGLLYAVFHTYAVGEAASDALARGYHKFDGAPDPALETAVVVLGSGSITVRNWAEERYSIVDAVAATRAVEAARVFRMLDARWVIASGGRVRPADRYEAPAITMRDALLALGVPAQRIVLQAESRNTREEALMVATLLARLGAHRVVLVTSRAHMRRTMGAFGAAGVAALPAIARDPYSADSWRDRFLPTDVGLRKTREVMHELFGIAYYVSRGWYSQAGPALAPPAAAEAAGR